MATAANRRNHLNDLRDMNNKEEMALTHLREAKDILGAMAYCMGSCHGEFSPQVSVLLNLESLLDVAVELFEQHFVDQRWSPQCTEADF